MPKSTIMDSGEVDIIRRIIGVNKILEALVKFSCTNIYQDMGSLYETVRGSENEGTI